jgi:ribonuclease P protein component
MAHSFSYSKEEKLKSRKLLQQLFANGKTFSVFPIKVFYMVVDEPLDFYIKAGVGTSSKNFKNATDRNRIKRLLRESYRLNKQPLHTFINEHKKQVAFFMLYIDKTLPLNNIVQSKMPLAIDKLIKAIQ